jgi:phenylacetate-CoA ligase
MSAYHLSAELAPSYFSALRQYRITYLWGYPSALGTLAEHAVRLGIQVPMRVAVGSAEPVLPNQRAAVARAFGCRLVETYGSTELVTAASECEAGRLHLWPEVGHVEVIDDAGHAVTPGTVGELVCTSLLNDAMPLIRYRTGDRGALDPDDAPCACGRRLPRLLAVEGRCDDAVITPDGRTVGRLDPVFKADIPVQEAQIVQEAVDRLRVKVVPAPGFAAAAEAAIVARVQERVGPMRVVVEVVEAIPRTRHGKFRAVINELTAEERGSR